MHPWLIAKWASLGLVLAVASVEATAQQFTPVQNRGRLGVYGKTYTTKNGEKWVQVTSVIPGSPATRLLKPPDATRRYTLMADRHFIVSVNDERVRSFDDLKAKLAASERHCMLKIYNSNTRSYSECYAELR